MTERWIHVQHPDDERFDKITIDTVPRWKESELSGDEYRFSYVIKAWRKGEVLIERGFSKLDWALKALSYVIYISDDPDKVDGEAYARTQSLCDQPGCDGEPSVWYKRLKRYTPWGEELADRPGYNEYRQFCAIHKHRGDCALYDADANYELIPNPNAKE